MMRANLKKMILAAGSVYVQIAFKILQADSGAELQEVLHIDENGVSNVTARTETSSGGRHYRFLPERSLPLFVYIL